MDATLNEVEGLIIEGFPCIKLYPKDKKYDNINYHDEYSIEAFLNVLEGEHELAFQFFKNKVFQEFMKSQRWRNYDY